MNKTTTPMVIIATGSCCSEIVPAYKVRKLRPWAAIPNKKRDTQRHGVKVPTFSTKPGEHAVYTVQDEKDALAIIDSIIDIADAISNGNGGPVEKAVDAACRECNMVLTPTTRSNVIRYLEK